MSDTTSPPSSPTPTSSVSFTPSGSVSDLSASTTSIETPPSIIDYPAATPTRDSALASIASTSTRSLSGFSDDEESESDAEQEWRESLQQLELLMSLVVIPFFGKWVGRRCAYWAWTRFMTWKHPEIDIVVTSRATHNIAGVVGAVASPGPPL